MAEYRAERYLAGDEIETHYDYPPLGTNKVWDRDEQPWVRNAFTDEWMPVAATAGDPRTCDWEGLLEEFGSVNDMPPGV